MLWSWEVSVLFRQIILRAGLLDSRASPIPPCRGGMTLEDLLTLQASLAIREEKRKCL